MSPDSPVWDVWEQIKSFYPGPTANWEAEPPIIWAVVLDDLTPEQLGKGVMNLVHHRDSYERNDFPPNAGQFKDLCLTNFEWERQAHKPFDPPVMIEDTGVEARTETAHDKAMEEMRGMQW